MCDIGAFKLRIIQAVCYLCGHDDFSVEDVRAAQPENDLNDNVNGLVNLIPYAICTYCGFTIEI